MQFKLSKTVILITLVVMAVGTAIWYLSHNSAAQIQIKPDYSTNRTIKDAGEHVTINFGQCRPDRRRIDVDFGSTIIVIIGPQKDGSCSLEYGGEVENPKWDGQLPFNCTVPQSLGSFAFRKSPYGVDLSSIQQYCTK
jgi:hypothetical protein